MKTKGRGGSKNEGRIVGPKWKFKQYGAVGASGSRELFPHLAKHVDDIAFLKSMTADSPIHGSAMLMMNTGKLLSGSPCLGSWVNYGLGSVNENLPGFVVMLDPTGGPISGAKNWSSGYMPATYAGHDHAAGKATRSSISACPRERPPEDRRELLDALRDAQRGASAPRGPTYSDLAGADRQLRAGVQDAAAARRRRWI